MLFTMGVACRQFAFLLYIHGLSCMTLVAAQHDGYDGTCGITRAERDRIRSETMRALLAKGYTLDKEGEVVISPSFNPSSFDRRFWWTKRANDSSPWLGCTEDNVNKIMDVQSAGRLSATAFNSDATTSLFYQLQPSDVILSLLCNPPVEPDGTTPVYYSMDDYMSFFDTSNLNYPAASVGYSLNDLEMNHTGTGQSSFGAASAILWTSDRVAADDVSAALRDAGLAPHAINVAVVPSQQLGITLGVGSTQNWFWIGGRIALWEPSLLRDAYTNYREPVAFFRATSRLAPPQPFPEPYKERSFQPTEREQYQSLMDSVVAQASSQISSEGSFVLKELEMAPVNVYATANKKGWYINGSRCIADPTRSSFCKYDTQDAAYFWMETENTASGFFGASLSNWLNFFFSDQAYVFGVNSNLTGYATYVSVAWQSLPGGSNAIDSRSFNPAGEVYAPSIEQAHKIFVVEMRNSCGGGARTPFPCLEVGTPGVLLARSYLNPLTRTGPDPFEVVRPRVLVFRKCWIPFVCHRTVLDVVTLAVLAILVICCGGCVWANRKARMHSQGGVHAKELQLGSASSGSCCEVI